jgi:3-oxoacyl-[acyl-carrier-protein] synthase-1
MSRCVVITGMGLVSCIGNELDQVSLALRTGRSGVRRIEEFVALDLNSQVAGIPSIADEPLIDRKIRRYMGDAAIYAYCAMRRAIADAGLSAEEVASPRAGLVVGSGVGSGHHLIEAVDIMRARGKHKVPPYEVPRIMASSASACLSTGFGVRGVSYSMSSACATSAHCIGNAFDLVASGRQDIVFAGGSEEIGWPGMLLFGAMGVLSTAHNEAPEAASRPYDAVRDGFVLAGGGGIVVVEALEHARARGARAYLEITGYGASSDGCDMVVPSAEGPAAAMADAAETLGQPVDYINTHATSTPQGDAAEVKAMQSVFGDAVPAFSSTKGITGHPIAAAGVHEAIYCALMMRDGFLAGSPTLQALDPAVEGLPLVRQSRYMRVDTMLSNSLGFGGTNVSLAFRRI